MANLFTIRSEVSPRARIALGLASWSVIILVWFGVTHWDLVASVFRAASGRSSQKLSGACGPSTTCWKMWRRVGGASRRRSSGAC